MPSLSNNMSESTGQRTALATIQQEVSRPKAPAAKKAGTFGPLSVCENRRVPSRAPRRSCTVIAPGGEPNTRELWTLRPRLRSSQARVEHSSRSRARSVRASSVVPTSNATRIPLSQAERPCRLPVVSTLGRPLPSESRRPSLTARARRSPSSSKYPPMSIDASATKYTFDFSLPIAIKPEMVTITTARGDKLKIVADAWHLETDCHFEWEIAFPPNDIDVSAIRAKFDVQGRLTVSAGRRVCNP